MRAVRAAPQGDLPMDFTVLRVPFFLEPDYPLGPEFEETNRVRLVRKWGGKEGWEQQKAAHDLKGRGRAVGIENFNLDRIASSTRLSHRVVQFVTKTNGVNAAERLYTDLNSRHFEKGEKLNDAKMLRRAAVAAGADGAAIDEFLADETAGVAEIEAAGKVMRDFGVSGIPTCILGGKWQLPSGAIHSEQLVSAFRGVEAHGGAPGNAFGAALGIPDEVLEEALVFD